MDVLGTGIARAHWQQSTHGSSCNGEMYGPAAQRVLPAAVMAQLQRLQEREEVRFGSDAGVCVDAAEVTSSCQLGAGDTARKVQPPSERGHRHASESCAALSVPLSH